MHPALAAILLVGMMLCDPVHAQRVEALASVDSARVGGRFLFTVSALHGFSEAPAFPDPQASPGAFGDLEDITVVAQGHAVLGPSARLDSIVYDVTTFALDSAIVPPLEVRLQGGALAASTVGFVLPVISVVPADADTIRGLADPVLFMEPDARLRWPWVLLGLAVVIVAAALWYWYTRSRTTVVDGEVPAGPQLSPYEQAMKRLEALERADLAAPGSEEPYFVALSEALRMYLEARIGVPALEMTTREVLDAFLHIRYKVPGGVPDAVQRVLGLSDLVKFAEFTPAIPESCATLAEARRVVEQLEAKQLQLAQDAARQEELAG